MLFVQKIRGERGGISAFYGIRVEFIIYICYFRGYGAPGDILAEHVKILLPLICVLTFRSLVSFVVLISAYVIFQESITVLNIIGLAIISIGIFYLGKDKEFLK